jgi:hypothetical protein
MSEKPVSERAKFPGAEVTRQEQDPFSVFGSAPVVFEPFVFDYAADVVRCQPWELRELTEQTTQTSENALDDPSPLGRCHVGERENQVPMSSAAESANQMITNVADGLSKLDRQASWKEADAL